MRVARVPEIWRQVSIGAVFESPGGRLVHVNMIQSFGRVDTSFSTGPRSFDTVEDFARYLFEGGFKFVGHEQESKS